jgi:hypothetical protein
MDFDHKNLFKNVHNINLNNILHSSPFFYNDKSTNVFENKKESNRLPKLIELSTETKTIHTKTQTITKIEKLIEKTNRKKTINNSGKDQFKTNDKFLNSTFQFNTFCDDTELPNVIFDSFDRSISSIEKLESVSSLSSPSSSLSLSNQSNDGFFYHSINNSEVNLVI